MSANWSESYSPSVMSKATQSFRPSDINPLGGLRRRTGPTASSTSAPETPRSSYRLV